jgi:glycosyltransferase involved in cell wall biosynthesis
MVNEKGYSSKLKKPYFPFVSVCTPTFNRRPFIPYMLDCFRNQDYPMDRMEWIIVDDGTDSVKDLIDTANIPQIKYFRPTSRMNLGEKRNYMHKQCKGSIIVYMDDDDYYPPERVSHAVERLMENRDALCAGSSEMYVYFKHIQKMVQCGPYGPNHATAGTFAFRVSLLDQTKYEDNAALAEERAFLKNYTIPFVQLDPLKTILVFSHIHNTFDKKKLLENPHHDYLKESPKTVEMFIKNPNEAHIKKFFTEDVDDILQNYFPGLPAMKPAVLAQTKQMEEERQRLMSQPVSTSAMKDEDVRIMMNEPGKEPVPLTMVQIAELLQQLDNTKKVLTEKNAELTRRLSEKDETIRMLQQQLLKSKTGDNTPPVKFSNTTPFVYNSTTTKSDPEVFVKI